MANLTMLLGDENSSYYQYDDLPGELSEYDNYDDAIYSEDLSMLWTPWKEDKAFLPTVVTYGIAFAVGVIGNSLVVFSLLCDRQSRNVTSSFLVSLAVADLLFLLICVPYETMAKHAEYWKGGLALCKLSGFIEMLSGCATVFNLTAISVERYCVIVHPMKSRSWFTMGNTKRVILTVWLAASLLSSPLLKIMNIKVYLFYNNSTRIITMSCEDSNFNADIERVIFAWYQFLLMFVIPTAVMVYCYTIVIRVLWISTKQLAQMTQTNSDNVEESRRLTSGNNKNIMRKAVKDQSHEVREARKQVIKMLLTVIALFLLCWGPKLLLNMFRKHSFSFMTKTGMFEIQLGISILPYIQSATNPIIYGFMSKNFRRSMRVSFRYVCRCDPCYPCRWCSEPRRHHSYEMETKSMTTNGGALMTRFDTGGGRTNRTEVTGVTELKHME